ncbi:MAG TPA: class II fructose-bisphosphate aldolase [Stellaceae bacterium]|nr:class II fructose-bisphosphate aldolase [Stellaceae bacterium]
MTARAHTRHREPSVLSAQRCCTQQPAGNAALGNKPSRMSGSPLRTAESALHREANTALVRAIRKFRIRTWKTYAGARPMLARGVPPWNRHRPHQQRHQMMTLSEALNDARRRHVAIGHFNVADLVALKAVTEAARGLKLPVLIGASEGERGFLGVREIAAVVASLRETLDHPIFLNADHTHSLEGAIAAAEAGFDMIGFDASTNPLETNVKLTKQAVEAVKSINRSIVVEGELGNIGSGSEIHDKVPESSRFLTKAEEAKQFVEATGIDVLAPAVGNMHGLLKSMISGDVKKRLDISRIRDVAGAAGIPLTLHGGSGTDDGDFQKAILAGMTIVHINTEIRLAWRRGLEASLAENPDEVVPYKIYNKPLDEMRKVVSSRLRLFNGV